MPKIAGLCFGLRGNAGATVARETIGELFLEAQQAPLISGFDEVQAGLAIIPSYAPRNG